MRSGAVAGVLIAAMAAALPVSGGVIASKGVAATRCPGWLRATEQDVSGARTVWTMADGDRERKDGGSPAPGSMSVHVVFQAAQAAVQSMEYTVSYLPVGVRGTRMSVEARSAAALKKNYRVTARNQWKVERDLLVGPASMITRVHVESVRFADGSEWRAANDEACSVEPRRVLPGDAKEGSITW